MSFTPTPPPFAAHKKQVFAKAAAVQVGIPERFSVIYTPEQLIITKLIRFT